MATRPNRKQSRGKPQPPEPPVEPVDPADDVHPVVRELSESLGMATATAFADASNLAERVMFAGFRGPVVEHPGRGEWRLLYLDLELRDWLLIETTGILAQGKVKDEAVPTEIVAQGKVKDETVFGEQSRDVFWVKADAAVGRGDASQTVQAQFLTGRFTRAADFEAPLSGGTLAAATGVFCEARTPSCCLFKSKRP